MTKFATLFLGGKKGGYGLLILSVLLLVVIPATLDVFRVNNVAKYLSYAFVAIGLVVCWGHGGILSLGQGVFWGLGGYCLAAFLKLEAARNIALEASSDQMKALTTVGLPDFMDWNQITTLPWFWLGFKSLPMTILLVLVVPSVLAFLLGTAIFKRRVAGVYFAIITQALAWIMEMLFVTRQGWTGGINGITDLRTMLGWDIRTQSAQYVLYYTTVLLLIGCILLCRSVLTSKLGRLLVALRDEEDRVRFSGYDPANIKRFAFVLASVISAIGGAMFVLNVGFMSPKLVTIEPSIYMVIFCAVGGRMSLIGAVYGTLLVNFARTYFSEEFPAMWYFLMGAVFIAVTRFFPNGLAGIYDDYVVPGVIKGAALVRTSGRRAPGPGAGMQINPGPTGS
ncbi:MAG TPA: urea ABC transporter permease subunit UrtC [Tepidisphaeraceae bacterium]|jgi:urea transport system permease protein